jgi:UDP-2-acetamido-3-amino-2,3-dideoxy-glucuronate N-acetyltransferase
MKLEVKTMHYFSHPTAVIDQPCEIGSGTRIWHFAHICATAVIGSNCSFGQNTMVAGQARIGSNVKVQNNVAIYAGTTIEDDVFLGPSCVLTNVTNPRSQVVRQNLYEPTMIRRGATVGANATIVCGVTLGRYCFISAGAVVTRDVPDYALIVGLPGRQVGWMSRHAHRLQPDERGECQCPESGFAYRLEPDEDGVPRLRCLDLDEGDPLPQSLAQGKSTYDQFKAADLALRAALVANDR